MKKENVLVSFSGGETSAFMSKWMWDNCQKYFNMVFVFANTGLEDYETLSFVAECSRKFGFKVHLIEAKINQGKGNGTTYVEKESWIKLTDPDSVHSFTPIENRTPFEQMVIKYGLPNPAFPHCTRELKTVPIRKFGQDYFGTNDFYQAIGIRYDEIDRMSVSRIEKKLLYPLITLKIGHDEIKDFWDKQNFKLHLDGYQGNCVFCWKKDFRKLALLAKEKYHIGKHFHNLEMRYKNHYVNEVLIDEWGEEKPIRMYRGHKTFGEIADMEVSKEEVLQIKKQKQESCDAHAECGIDN